MRKREERIKRTNQSIVIDSISWWWGKGKKPTDRRTVYSSHYKLRLSILITFFSLIPHSASDKYCNYNNIFSSRSDPSVCPSVSYLLVLIINCIYYYSTIYIVVVVMPKQINKFSRRTNVVVVNNTHTYIGHRRRVYRESIHIYIFRSIKSLSLLWFFFFLRYEKSRNTTHTNNNVVVEGYLYT